MRRPAFISTTIDRVFGRDYTGWEAGDTIAERSDFLFRKFNFETEKAVLSLIVDTNRLFFTFKNRLYL